MKDKEKQIYKYCGKPIKSAETKTIKERIADYDGNYFCSCNEEKQIEEMRIQRKIEMTKDISNGINGVLAY